MLGVQSEALFCVNRMFDQTRTNLFFMINRKRVVLFGITRTRVSFSTMSRSHESIFNKSINSFAVVCPCPNIEPFRDAIEYVFT